MGIILICDSMGAEMGGSRQLLHDLSAGNLASGGSWHMIKPMLYQEVDKKRKFSYEFMDMLKTYYVKNEKPDRLPIEILQAAQFLKKNGVEKIGLIGMCWGGCVVQHIMNSKYQFNVRQFIHRNIK